MLRWGPTGGARQALKRVTYLVGLLGLPLSVPCQDGRHPYTQAQTLLCVVHAEMHRPRRPSPLTAFLTLARYFVQTTPPVTFTEAEKKAMTDKIANAGTVVVEAKAGKGSATLSMVRAALRLRAGGSTVARRTNGKMVEMAWRAAGRLCN